MQDTSLAAPSKPGIGLGHINVGEDFLLYMGIFNPSFCTFPLSPFTLDLLCSRFQNPLYTWPFRHSGHRTSYILIVYAPTLAHLTTI